MALDDIVRDRGEGELPRDVRRLPADPAGQEPNKRSVDHNAVDTQPRDDKRVEPPAMGGKARDRDDRHPFEVDGVESVDFKAKLEDIGPLAGLLSLLG